jgi:hypothetical protein
MYIDGRSLIVQRSCRSHDHRFDLDGEIQTVSLLRQKSSSV